MHSENYIELKFTIHLIILQNGMTLNFRISNMYDCSRSLDDTHLNYDLELLKL